MKKLLLAIVVLFPACSPAYVRHSRLIGPATYAIDCGDEAAECLEFALARCPYGYAEQGSDSQVSGISVGFGKVRIRRENSLTVTCKAPAFCSEQACPYGMRCVSSQSYPDHPICVVQ